MALLVAVMRTQGSLRLILNTKLWAQMQIDKASEKSIRITAMDTEDQGVKVFLISVRGAPRHTPRGTGHPVLRVWAGESREATRRASPQTRGRSATMSPRAISAVGSGSSLEGQALGHGSFGLWSPGW